MKTKLLFTAVILTACGQPPVENVKQDNVSESQTNYALKVDNKRDLFECTDEHDKQLVYVVDTAEMLTCDKRTWVAIDLQGKDGKDGANGKDGKDGQDGVDGQNGIQGEQGIAGQDGQQGIQGIQGQQGQQGQQGVAGANGTDAATVNVLNPDGSILGRLIDIYVVNNEYYVLTPDGLRLQYEHATGVLRNVYMLFSGANCTGTARIMIENGLFGNVFIDGRDNTTIYKTTGKNLGTFNYASRLPKTTGCQNSSGSALRSHAFEQVTGMTYPIINTEIEN